MGTALDTDARTHARNTHVPRAATTNRIHVHVRAGNSATLQWQAGVGNAPCASASAPPWRVFVRASARTSARLCLMYAGCLVVVVIAVLLDIDADVVDAHTTDASRHTHTRAYICTCVCTYACTRYAYTRVAYRPPRLIVDLCGIGPRLREHGYAPIITGSDSSPWNRPPLCPRHGPP